MLVGGDGRVVVADFGLARDVGPPNEVIPGSASPSGQQYWWDKYGPPTEYSMQVVSGGNKYFFGHHFSRGPSSWQLITDGYKDAAGVHYKTSGRLASIFQYQTDVTDNSDGNGVASYIQSELEYICKPDRISSVWKFRPRYANVLTDNLFVYVWLAYSQEMDGTGSQSPGRGSSPALVPRRPDDRYGQRCHCRCALVLLAILVVRGPQLVGAAPS